MSSLRHKYIGDKAFYKHVLYMVIPMILQNLVTNFVSMVDNIMVGQLGTAPMSGVSIVNQFVFVATLQSLVLYPAPAYTGLNTLAKAITRDRSLHLDSVSSRCLL